MKTIFTSFLLFLLMINKIQAQQYSSTELSTIKPIQLLIENYTRIILSKEMIDDGMANQFDINNPYTYIQLLSDATGNIYHIIYQTNFSGKIMFLAYSNNLSRLFNKPDKPMFLFQHCLKEVNNHLSPVQVTTAAIKCLIDRLNYCAGD